jgi:hypothetical protein
MVYSVSFNVTDQTPRAHRYRVFAVRRSLLRQGSNVPWDNPGVLLRSRERLLNQFLSKAVRIDSVTVPPITTFVSYNLNLVNLEAVLRRAFAQFEVVTNSQGAPRELASGVLEIERELVLAKLHLSELDRFDSGGVGISSVSKSSARLLVVTAGPAERLNVETNVEVGKMAAEAIGIDEVLDAAGYDIYELVRSDDFAPADPRVAEFVEFFNTNYSQTLDIMNPGDREWVWSVYVWRKMQAPIQRTAKATFLKQVFSPAIDGLGQLLQTTYEIGLLGALLFQHAAESVVGTMLDIFTDSHGIRGVILGQLANAEIIAAPAGVHAIVYSLPLNQAPGRLLNAPVRAATNVVFDYSPGQLVQQPPGPINAAPTAGFLMLSGTSSATQGQILNLSVLAGSAARVTFDGQPPRSSDPDGTIGAYEWQIDEGSAWNAGIFSVDLGKGMHTVSLVVTDNGGLKSQPATGTVVISEQPTVSDPPTNATWSLKQSQTTPPLGRERHGLAYDQVRSEVVLFGGFGMPDPIFPDQWGCCLNDTWTWDGVAWTEKSPANPPSARHGMTMVYDGARREVVLFGGTGLDDTWVWNGAAWVQRSPVQRPSARSYAAAAYDSIRGEVVMFGGSGAGGPLADTWVWDGSSWTERFPLTKPPARFAGAMAYDPERREVLLFGGSGPNSSYLNDTWVWNGSDWSRKLTATTPPPRIFHGLTHHADFRGLVLFGGASPIQGGGSIILSDTWFWNGQDWIQIALTTKPSGGRSTAPLVFDEARREVILFSGWVEFRDTWGLK